MIDCLFFLPQFSSYSAKEKNLNLTINLTPNSSLPRVKANCNCKG